MLLTNMWTTIVLNVIYVGLLIGVEISAENMCLKRNIVEIKVNANYQQSQFSAPRLLNNKPETKAYDRDALK